MSAPMAAVLGCAPRLAPLGPSPFRLRSSHLPPSPRPPTLHPPSRLLSHSPPLRLAANGYTVSLPTQRVVVYGPSLPPFDTITEKIAKTGKEILSKEEIAAGAPVPPVEA